MSKRLKILVVTPWYPHVEHIFAGAFVREHALAVKDRCDVVVLHCSANAPETSARCAIQRETDENLAQGIPTYRATFRPSRPRWCAWPRQLWTFYRAVRTIVKEHGRPDVIHAHVYVIAPAALMLGKWLGVPVVITEHASCFSRGLVAFHNLLITRWVYSRAAIVLPVSRAMQDHLDKSGIHAHYRVVPNIVDTNVFRPSSSHIASDGPVRMIAVSSLIKRKGLAVLFHALTQLPRKPQDWRLDVVGVGAEAAEHYQMVKDLGLEAKVTFHGPLPTKNEVAQMVQAADFFVLPSLQETFSVTTAEALAVGLPVVVTRCGGPEEYVTERTGIVVPPGDTVALAEALATMLERHSSYDRTAIARESKDRFSAETIGATLNEIYLQAVKAKTNA